MAITAAQVKELREMSGAGMMDCKKALTETNGDMDAAIEFLRKSGVMKAEKKAGRVAAEGLVRVAMDGDKKAAIVEVNSETDFVAKNEKFQKYVEEVAAQALASGADSVEAMLEEPWLGDAEKTVKDVLTSQIATIGENLSIRRFERITTDGVIVPYIHGGGRIGVIVEAACDSANDAVKTIVKNVAMQVAAMRPKYVSRDEISEEYLNHEKEILIAQAKAENTGKPDNILEKMVIGRLNKELKEICLLDQPYIQDGDLTVAKYVAQAAKEAGASVEIKRFVRFETGEGIEKKEENFAEEVAKQMGQ